jgi:Zn finger protein HypA/HybF involved in hydrogenase expression
MPNVEDIKLGTRIHESDEDIEENVWVQRCLDCGHWVDINELDKDGLCLNCTMEFEI